MAKYAKVKDFLGNVQKIATKKDLKKIIEKNEIILLEMNCRNEPSQLFIHFSRIYSSLKFVNMQMTLYNLGETPNTIKKSTDRIEKSIEIYKYGYLIYKFTNYLENFCDKKNALHLEKDLLEKHPNLDHKLSNIFLNPLDYPLYNAIKTVEDLSYRNVLYIYHFSTIIGMINSIINFFGKLYSNIPKDIVVLLLTILIVRFL
jgi:hypothetical protein